MERKDVETIINTFVEMVKETSKKSDEVLLKFK
jgi:nucleoid DNA-binding protein